MKEYDLIVVGYGSPMSIVDPMIQQNPKIKIAVIDKDQPGYPTRKWACTHNR